MSNYLNSETVGLHGGSFRKDDVPKLTGANIPFIIKARVVLLRDLGASLSPFNSFQIIQGLETLSLRIKQHCKNAIKVKEFLETSEKIEKVIF